MEQVQESIAENRKAARSFKLVTESLFYVFRKKSA
eukprot:CAMPEP_0206212398 /NCGR_PEP_ID=MMETSP0047_2-20121206/543_1 /ASSEMBLY_ACC=CAM_ASM_000192 /TAXON_ID=195065 /ORGANISM="Chroomonas mesostigmatica_cf, Strain CCMP1168" /LENGTH=34 /DNA_ID= /DNA_START= /DNA_END= /DNA_ORIENTATION=